MRVSIFCFRVPAFRSGILNLQTGHRIEEGQIVRHMKPGQCLFGGCFSKEFQKQLEVRGGSAYDLMRCEHVITENAAVTAEGAIAEAVMRSSAAFRGSVCILTGYGRCGSALHRRLKNWGCRLMVYDCEKDACERAKKEGAVVCSREMLAKEAEKAAFIFNTAPLSCVDRRTAAADITRCLFSGACVCAWRSGSGSGRKAGGSDTETSGTSWKNSALHCRKNPRRRTAAGN